MLQYLWYVITCLKHVCDKKKKLYNLTIPVKLIDNYLSIILYMMYLVSNFSGSAIVIVRVLALIDYFLIGGWMT